MTSSQRLQRWLAVLGAGLAACAVALSAYAAHGVDAASQPRLQLAAVFAFGHGVALAALARGPMRRLSLCALLMLLAGTVLFAGGLAVAQFAGVATHTAPFGGVLLIGGWLLYAIDAARA
ncbi:MAG: DUF423 domain-containing protein [Luteimonas sp.]